MWSTTGRSTGARTFIAVATLCLTACSPAQPAASPASSATAMSTPPASLAPTSPPATAAPSAAPRNPAAFVEGAPYAPAIDPANFVDGIDHPFMPFKPGARWVFGGAERIVVEVLDETRVVMGITVTVVRDRVFEDGALVEDTRDWYAQDRQGNVWYMGEETAEYENGEVVTTAGSWEAGVDGAMPGIVMLADPQVGDVYRQEFYEGEAEDIGTVTALGGEISVPAGTWSAADVLVTEEWTPLEPDVREQKTYASGVGVVHELQIEGGDDEVFLRSYDVPQ